MAALMILPMDSALICTITRKGVMRAGEGQESGFLSLLGLPLIIKVLGKGFTGAGKGYNNMDKNF